MKNLLKYINNQSSKNYDPGNKIIFNTEVLNLTSLTAMMLVKDDITIIAAPAAQVSSKNCAPFTKCNTKID